MPLDLGGDMTETTPGPPPPVATEPIVPEQPEVINPPDPNEPPTPPVDQEEV